MDHRRRCAGPLLRVCGLWNRVDRQAARDGRRMAGLALTGGERPRLRPVRLGPRRISSTQGWSRR